MNYERGYELMRLKKKLLGIMVCFALVLSLMPGMSMTALAAEPSVTCDPADGGTVDIETSTDARWEYILTANPNEGYAFYYWDDGTQVSNLGGNRLGINGGQSVTCRFVKTYTVTYKVVGGTWSDGTTADKTETVMQYHVLENVPTGMVAATGYTGGSWDSSVLSEEYPTVNQDTTFTYTFVADSSSGQPLLIHLWLIHLQVEILLIAETVAHPTAVVLQVTVPIVVIVQVVVQTVVHHQVLLVAQIQAVEHQAAQAQVLAQVHQLLQ